MSKKKHRFARNEKRRKKRHVNNLHRSVPFQQLPNKNHSEKIPSCLCAFPKCKDETDEKKNEGLWHETSISLLGVAVSFFIQNIVDNIFITIGVLALFLFIPIYKVKQKFFRNICITLLFVLIGTTGIFFSRFQAITLGLQAGMYKLAGFPDEAINNYKRAISFDKTLFKYDKYIADILFDIGEFDEGYKALEKSGMKDADSYYKLAYKNNYEADYEIAYEHVTHAIEEIAKKSVKGSHDVEWKIAYLQDRMLADYGYITARPDVQDGCWEYQFALYLRIEIAHKISRLSDSFNSGFETDNDFWLSLWKDCDLYISIWENTGSAYVEYNKLSNAYLLRAYAGNKVLLIEGIKDFHTEFNSFSGSKQIIISWDSIEADFSKASDDLLSYGTIARARKDTDSSARLWLKQLYIYRGDTYFERANRDLAATEFYNKAVKYYSEGLELIPDDIDLLYRRAKCYDNMATAYNDTSYTVKAESDRKNALIHQHFDSITDDFIKYYIMLEQGMLSEQEFSDLKKKLIGIN